jgi:hypothetical protein
VGLPQTLNAYPYCLNNPINTIDPSGEIPPWLAAVLVIGETLDPLPLDPLVWTLIGLTAIETAKNAPDAVRAIGRLIDPPVRERTKTRPWRWWEGAPLAPENLPQRPTPPVETFDPWMPLPRSTPRPRIDPRLDPRLTPCPPQVTTTPQPGEHRVLIVGDGDFGYSTSLHARRPDWKITGTGYGDGSNRQVFLGSDGNLTLYTNVDATRLESGAVTGVNQYNAIIFNNPYADNGRQTASLIRGFRQSAQRVLAPGGEIHINVTQKLLLDHEDVAAALGLSNNNSSTVKNLPSFGQTKYYAPFTPHYSAGGAMNYYRGNPTRVANLKNFVFR